MTALYSTYRSQRFDDLVGQDATVRTLKNALVSGRVAHAYLLSGIRGTGKTSTARILAKAVNCDNPLEGEPCNECPSCLAITDSSATDLIEIDAASNRGIDEIRDLREKAKYLPALLKRKVYIIDEAHQLTPEAFNALLKTLEEPPGHVLFILCTTEAHKLPATIVSRCQRFDFRRITAENIAARLRYIAGKENLAADDGALSLIATMAQGSMRDAITMLDQMASAGVETIDAESVRRQLGLVNAADIAALLAGAARGDTALVLRDLDRLAQQGADMRQLTNSLADMARRAVLVSLGAADAAGLGIDDAAAAGLTEIVASAGREFAAAAFEAAMLASSEMKQTHDPRLLLELLLLRLSAGAGARAGAGDGTGAGARAGAGDGTGAGAAAGAGAGAFPAAPSVAATPAAPPATGAGAGRRDGSDRKAAAGGGGGGADAAAAVDDAEADEPSAAEPQPSPLPAVAAQVAVAAPADPLPSDAALDAIRERWPALLEALKGTSPSTRVKALLVSSAAAPAGLDDDLLTIGFRWAVHSEKAQEPTNRQALEAAISQVYGRTYRLQFKVVAMSPPADAATPSPEGDNASGGPSPTGSAGETPGQGLVQAAQEILGARVVDVRNRESAGG